MAATGELVVEEVADNLEEVAAAVRKFDPKLVGALMGGIGIGIVVGFVIGYRYNREKIRAEAFAESEEELEKIREYYERTHKPDLEEIVEEKGYSEIPETKVVIVDPRPLPPPVPVMEPEPLPRPKSVVRTEEAEKDKNEGWSYPAELQRRNSRTPHIIHQDEFFGRENEYSQATLTYYEGDDVLADEDDSVIKNRENLIGTDVLTRFGHGTDDFNVVYLRNPYLEIEYEICRHPGKYEVEVQGLEDDDTDSTNES